MDDLQYRINFFYDTYLSNKVINKALCNYDEKLEDLLKDGNKINKDLLQVLYIASNLTMRKEESIVKLADQYKLKVNKTLIDILVNKVVDSTNDMGEITINGVTFSDTINFINVIRNKFAHSDYKFIAENKTIDIIVNDKTISISLTWLILINKLVFENMDKAKNDGYYNEGIIKVKDNSFTQIKSYKNFKKALSEMKYYEFVVTPKTSDNSKDKYGKARISQLIKEIENDIGGHKNPDSNIRKLQKYCEESDLNLKINIIPISSFSDEEKKKLANMYQSTSDFNEFSIVDQIKFMCLWIVDVKLNTNTVSHISQGYSIAQDFVQYLDKGKSYHSFVQEYPDMVYFYDKTNIAVLFAQFNIAYSYSIEQIHEKYLDYSKLDLSEIKYTINKFEDLEMDYLDSELASLQTRIDNAVICVEEANEHLDKLIITSKKDPSKEQTYDKGKQVLINKQQLQQQKLDELNKAYLVLFNRKQEKESDIALRPRYYENKNIINHIRNSLAHGNFEIERFNEKENGSLTDIKIHFQDIYKGENTFDSVINLTEFATLFSTTNYKEIFDTYINLSNKLLHGTIDQNDTTNTKK